MKMLPGPIDNGMLAPCGMNCLVCYKHCDSPKPCGGCRTGDENKPAHCRRCRIRDCVREKHLSHCFTCDEYPCRFIKALEKSYRTRYGVSLLANGRCVKEKGLAAFLEQQKARYTCPMCGGVVSLHDAVCSECGRPAK